MITQEQEKQIIDLYVNQGFSLNKIRKILKMGIKTVSSLLQKNNINIKPRKFVTEEEKSKIIDMYINQKLSCMEIGRRLNLFYDTVSINLVKWGYKIRPKQTLDQKTQEKIVAKYKSGIYLPEIAKKFKISLAMARLCLVRRGIKERNKRPRKIYFDENYFDILDNQSKFWILGYLWSDGNVSSTGKCISFFAHKKDKDSLVKISNLLNANPKKSIKTGKTCLILRLNSTILHPKLIKMGCMPNKSLIIKYPVFINEEKYHWAFLRGLWEGDGSFGLKHSTQKDSSSCYCSLASGSIDIIDYIKQYIENNLNIPMKIYFSKTSQTKALNILGGTENILKFLTKLYESSTPETRLDRKYNNYLEIKRRFEAKYGNPNLASISPN